MARMSLGASGNKSNYDTLEDILSAIGKQEGRLAQGGYQNLLELEEEKDKPSKWEQLMNVLTLGEEASARTAKSLITGRGLPSAKELKKTLGAKDNYDYQQLLADMGMRKGIGRSALGLALGIGLDPVTYVPFAKVGQVAGKVLSPAVKVGRKIPGVKQGIQGLEGLATWGRQARGVAKLADEGLNTIDVYSKGVTGRVTATQNEIVAKYKDMFEGFAHIPEKEKKKFLIAAEHRTLPTKYKLGLSDETIKLVNKFGKFLDETGLEKQRRGIIQDMFGNKVTTQPGMQMTLPFTEKYNKENLDQLLSYTLHLPTQEYRQYLKKQSANPEEWGELAKGMAKTMLGKKEKSRTLVSSINEINTNSVEKLGIKMFEDDPVKILNAYTRNLAKNTAMHDMAQELLQLKYTTGGKAGQSILQETVLDPVTKKIPKGMVELTGFPFEGKYMATPEVAQKLNRINGILSSDAELNKFISLTDKVLNIWKYSVTVPWPNFNIKNFIGASFNNYIYDAESFKEIGNAFAMARGKPGVVTNSKGVAKTFQEIRQEAQKRGVYMGFAEDVKDLGGKARQVVDALRNKGPSKWLTKDLPEGVENVVRNQLFLSQWKKTGSFDDAARAVWKAHGNYAPEMLSTAEREVVNRAVPFYKWMRANVPFQLENMYKQTGKYAAVAKTQRALVPESDREGMPDWMREQMFISAKDVGLNTKGVLTLELPIQDLLKVGDPEAMFSTLSPLLKIPTEMFMNKEVFTDREIVDKDLPKEMQRDTVYGALTILPEPLKKALNFQEVQKFNKAKGEWEVRYEADAKKMYLLRNLAGGYFGKPYYGTREAQRKLEYQGIDKPTPANQALAFGEALVSPVKTYTYSPENQEYFQAMQRRAQLQAIINNLLQRKKIPYAR